MTERFRIPFGELNREGREEAVKKSGGPFIITDDGEPLADWIALRYKDILIRPFADHDKEWNIIGATLEIEEAPAVLGVAVEKESNIFKRLLQGDYVIYTIEEVGTFTSETARMYSAKREGFPKGHRKVLGADENGSAPHGLPGS